ncbi:MAG TPA: DivIVA domain-containing protein [Actinoplanes sp.]|nr:DivIVA domain-containing protein [Actinoplanes sp.]
MPLTPADIHNTEFTRASFGRRGYDEDDVDTLLDEVTGEMIRLLEENTALHDRLAADSSGDQDRNQDQAATVQLSGLAIDLGRARQACEHAVQQARLARHQLDEARRTAVAPAAVRPGTPPPAMLRMAQRTADSYLHEAQEKSGMLRTEAQERAGRTLQDARDTVDAIGRRSRQHQDEAAAELAADRASMTRDIDEMTRWIVRHRAGLQNHLRHQEELMDDTTG